MNAFPSSPTLNSHSAFNATCQKCHCKDQGGARKAAEAYNIKGIVSFQLIPFTRTKICTYNHADYSSQGMRP